LNTWLSQVVVVVEINLEELLLLVQVAVVEQVAS
jgi:hypothetical protein